MPVLDLTRYIVDSAGTWTDPSQDHNIFGFTREDTMSPSRLLLRWAGDFVALTGPLRVRVTVQAENMTVPLALVGNLRPEPAAVFERPSSGLGPNVATISSIGLNEVAAGHIVTNRALGLQASTIYSYTLDIAAGNAWPFSLSEQLAALRLQNLRASRFEQLGNNLGFRVIIEPAFVVPDCTPIRTTFDLPCDFASADNGNTARFFPAACEPCNGTVIGLPPAGTVTLITPPADGGCVRTRYFNGMFITSEDLETEQRYMRLKSKLHNRASGAGVVWGFGLGKEGDHLCVLPGYGVDCCGNDLTITTTYKVDIAALIADPAAQPLARQRGPNRMHLLLEYIECPSEARPVHGDICSTDVNRCEMSRIRETVRLRLVPPRDCQSSDSEPIRKFLDEVNELRKRYPLEQAPGMPPSDRAPYQLSFTPNRRAAVMVRPSPAITNVDLGQGRLTSLTIEVVPDPMWTFVRGTLSAQALGPDGKPIPDIVTPRDPIPLSLKDGFNTADLRVTFNLRTGANTRLPGTLEFKLTNWQAQTFLAGEDDDAISGDLLFTVALSGEGNESSLRASAAVVAPLDIAAPPCSGEPCAPRQRPPRPGRLDCGAFGAALDADPTPALPWLHADPLHAGKAADPKVLMLAALNGWLSQMTAREREGASGEIKSPRREIAQGIYRAAWLLLFGMPQRADAAMLGRTLHRLLEAWCDELLWKGPRCCGDPHGVVIGCAVVEAGTIQSVDPFGGRRYVVHYPLLEHWGSQFGIAPLDVTAMRFFSKLCCLASLPANDVGKPNLPSVAVPLGGGHLLIGEPAAMAENLRDKNIVAQRKVGMAEMIASTIVAINTKRNGAENRPYTALILGDFVAQQTVMLLTPA